MKPNGLAGLSTWLKKDILVSRMIPRSLILDTFKFMTLNAVIKSNGIVFSIKSNRFAFCSVQAEFSSRAPLLQAVQITLKPAAIVNTFNGHKKFEIIGIAQTC
jgi:hypothetical protein